MTESTAVRIRQFLRDLLGSRVAECREEELLRCRNDYETRLHERDEVITELRQRVSAHESKLERWEMVILPLASPIGNMFNPKRPTPTETFIEPVDPNSWSAIKAAHYRSMSEEPNGEQVQAES